MGFIVAQWNSYLAKLSYFTNLLPKTRGIPLLFTNHLGFLVVWGRELIWQEVLTNQCTKIMDKLL